MLLWFGIAVVQPGCRGCSAVSGCTAHCRAKLLRSAREVSLASQALGNSELRESLAQKISEREMKNVSRS